MFSAMTVLMPNWYYEKKDLKRSPSIIDGLDCERENRYRREGARFIINVGTKMGLRYDTMATGVVYFHRFYMFHSFKTFPRYVTACCCLFLAGKVEETPKKCKDIIRTAKTFLAENQFTQFGDDPGEEVMTLERILLQTIKFDLQVDHPYGHLLKYAKSLKGDNKKLQSMVQMAWTFINDSLCTTLSLQWEPEVIAIALMYLAGKLSKFEVADWVGRTSKHSHWWDMFVEGMSIELLEDICHQVLDLYSTPMANTPQDSPPATPPTKSTRKTSEPPSPVEAATSPAQPKLKETPVGLPIPRLEPGELKRKVSHSESKKETESKVPRLEGKAIPTISSSNSSPPKKIPIIKGTSVRPSTPISPKSIETISKVSKLAEAPLKRSSYAEPAFRSGITSTINTQPYLLNPATETTPIKPAQSVPVAITSTFALSLPPPTATYTQSVPPFYTAVAAASSEAPAYPNITQPPPQIFPQQFQHPPPVPPSSSLAGLAHPPPQFGDPNHQYPTLPPGSVPPFNAQFPPPPPIRPPNVINNPSPAPLSGLSRSPASGMMRSTAPPPPPGVTSKTSAHPPPPGVTPRNSAAPPPPGVGAGLLGAPPRSALLPPHGPGEKKFTPRSGSDMYRPRPDGRGIRLPLDQRMGNRDFVHRGPYDEPPRFPRRPPPDFDHPFPHNAPFMDFDPGFHRPPRPGQFGPDFDRPMPRRFPPDLHQLRNQGPRPRMMNNMPQQPGSSTGIPPVRITGSM